MNVWSTQFTINDFVVLQDKKEQLTEPTNKFSISILLLKKAIVSKLPRLASCISGLLCRNEDVEESNAVYVDIISLPADFKDTIL